MRADTGGTRRFWTMACAVAMAMSLAGCGSSSNYVGETTGATEEYVGAAAVDNEAEYEDSAAQKGETADENSVIIKDAAVSLRTRDYDAALETVRQIIGEAGGTIVSSNESGGYGRSITIETRVDPDKIEDTVERLRTIEGCTVLSANLNSTDVTRTFNDTERRIEILEEQYEHYKGMLEAATTTEDMLLISDRMYDVLAEIKVLTDERDDMAHNAARSLLRVTIDEELASGQTVESRGNIYADAWEDSWGFFGNALQALVLLIIFLVPFALVVAAIFALVLLIRRRRRARRQGEATTEATTGTTETAETTDEATTREGPLDSDAPEQSQDTGDGRPPRPPLA